MNYSEFLDIRNITSIYEVKIYPAPNFDLESHFKNGTDNYVYFVNWKKKLQDHLVDHVPLDAVIPVTIVYLLILILGFFGNITTCMVIFKSPSLRNGTNYYLFNLAISDVIISVIGKNPFIIL